MRAFRAQPCPAANPDYASAFPSLLPGGRPRCRLSLVSSFSLAIHAGGRPLRFAPPAARRSSARMASSNRTRSSRISASIWVIFILFCSDLTIPAGPSLKTSDCSVFKGRFLGFQDAFFSGWPILTAGGCPQRSSVVLTSSMRTGLTT
jgi:hypothetical protein